jgi:hypothetical protein
MWPVFKDGDGSSKAGVVKAAPVFDLQWNRPRAVFNSDEWFDKGQSGKNKCAGIVQDRRLS